ncbi:hypothetical protein Droror1_Dr00012533, partial [Drosera rotundifolia]
MDGGLSQNFSGESISLDSNIQDDNDKMVEGENVTSTTVDVVNRGEAPVAPNGEV